MIRFTLLFITFLSFSLNHTALEGTESDGFKGLDSLWEEQSAEFTNKWDDIQKEQDEKWERYVNEIEAKWAEFIHSSREEWVTYSKDLDTRSIVDFKNGEIITTSISPIDKGIVGKKEAKRKIANHVKKIFSQDSDTGIEPLKDQVVNKKGEAVSYNNIDNFINKDVLPKTFIETKIIKSKDGIKRNKYTSKIKMVKDHLVKRAYEYIDLVKKYSNAYQISPALIMAIIHTESNFAPNVKSHKNAYGLMQLIPRFGAREAHEFIYGFDRIPPPSDLYKPDKNIELGTAYVHLLGKRYFSAITHPNKKKYLVISGYNWGPTNVKNKIIKRYSISGISSNKLFTILRKNSNVETSDYLKKVTDLIPKYEDYF